MPARKKANSSKKATTSSNGGPRRVVMELRAREEELAGKYSNVAVVRHTKREFSIDFIYGGEGANILQSRILTSPAHAKDIQRVLAENIAKYEEAFGKIDTSQDPK